MIKDSEIVTKKYIKHELSNFITKDFLKKELSNFVTKDFLKKELSNFATKDYLRTELKEQKYEILRDVRVMIFESLETIKVYFEEQGNRHREALLQGFKDEMLVYKDEVMTHREKLDDYGRRIEVLERR